MNNISLRQARQHAEVKVHKHRSFQQAYLPPAPCIPRHLLRADTVLRHTPHPSRNERETESELEEMTLGKQFPYSRDGISHSGGGLKPLQIPKDLKYRPETNTDLNSLKETLL